MDARAAGVEDADDGCAVADRHVLDLDDLLRVRRRERAAKDREVLDEEVDQPAVDRPPPRDDAVAGDAVRLHAKVGRAVFDEGVEFFEAALVQQDFQALAGRELAAGVLGLDALFPAPLWAASRRRSSSRMMSCMAAPGGRPPTREALESGRKLHFLGVRNRTGGPGRYVTANKGPTSGRCRRLTRSGSAGHLAGSSGRESMKTAWRLVPGIVAALAFAPVAQAEWAKHDVPEFGFSASFPKAPERESTTENGVKLNSFGRRRGRRRCASSMAGDYPYVINPDEETVASRTISRRASAAK